MYNFFGFLNRMKYIERWSLMRNQRKENVMEHSHSVSVIAHALACIGNAYFSKQFDSGKVCEIAAFHEASEVITGDLPTPVKYFNPDIKRSYKAIEGVANNKLLSMLPNELIPCYKKLLFCDTDSVEYALVKAADKISAYIKCLEETAAGNNEFNKAKAAIKSEIDATNLDEVKYFMDNFIKAYELSLDELDG